MSYTLISEIEELVSDKQTLSRGINDSMGDMNNMSINPRQMIESMPAQPIQRRFQAPVQSAFSYNPSYQNDMQYNQYPTKSLRRGGHQPSMFEKTPIIEVLQEEQHRGYKIKEKIKHKDDDDEEEDDDKSDKNYIKKIEEMNTKFVSNFNVMNDNILMLYKKVHNQDMMLKGIIFMLFIVLILVLRK